MCPRRPRRRGPGPLGARGCQATPLPPNVASCASLLFQRNVRPKFVQELLGYASVAITLDTYSHMLPGIGGETADAMGEVLG